MAPNPNPVWRKQILANLRLTSDHIGGIDIITSCHPNKSWSAYAVGTRKGKRHELLSATGRDPEEAFKALHVKSAQDVHQHHEAFGGFGPARDSDSDSSDSEASTVDDSVLSLSDASDSDNDDRRRKGKSHRRKHKRRSGKPSKRDSSEDDSSSDDEPVQRRRHTVPARPSYIPTPPITGTQPPPPPPGWRGPPARVFPRGPGGPPPPLPPPGRFQPGMRPGTVSPPQPQPVPTAPAKPVRIVIRWAGHGEKKIVEHCQPSHRALQRTALAHVRANWQSYENVIAQEMTPGRLWGLGAKVRRVAFGKDMYAISAAAGDDLAMYFKADDIPKFEVEVDHDGSIAPPPPPPPPAHAQ